MVLSFYDLKFKILLHYKKYILLVPLNEIGQQIIIWLFFYLTSF